MKRGDIRISSLNFQCCYLVINMTSVILRFSDDCLTSLITTSTLKTNFLKYLLLNGQILFWALTTKHMID